MDVGTAQRITVIGSPGAGKSTLATAVAAATGLPLIHLDREYWRPGWVEPNKAAWSERNAALVAGERWVIDGNYGSSLAMRLARADMVVWLDLPTRICLIGALRRLAMYRGRVRPDMQDDCTERLDRAFLAFLWYIVTFRRRKRPGIAAALQGCGAAVVRLESVAARRQFTRGLMPLAPMSRRP